MTFNFQTRRATVDDLAVLRNLWRRAKLPVPIFEKALADFQVVETADGQVFGAIGLQIAAQQGRIYGEAWAHPELAPDARSQLWQRLLTLARQHRLTRLWIESGTGPFWLDQGLELAGSEALKKLPAGFVQEDNRPWLMLQTREEPASRAGAELELELFRQAQQAQRERATRQARILRVFAILVVMLLLLLTACAGWFVLSRLGHSPFSFQVGFGRPVG